LRTIAITIAVTILAVIAADWEQPVRVMGLRHLPGLDHAGQHSLVLLAFGLLLTIPTWKRSGLRIGSIRKHWKAVLIVCGIPVLVTALVYPQLGERPFARAGAEMWLISPLAQDLVFMGFIYGILESSFPDYVHPRVPVRRGLLIGAVAFAAWHLPNLFSAMSPAFLAFQLLYTSAGFVLTGLSRQWTGSLLYATLSHSGVNCVVWLAA
jgi:membrane protease YdiL (CAAX protease family)